MAHTINDNEISMLRAEIEILIKERAHLLKIVGISASLIAELDSSDLPKRSIEAAEILAAHVNGLSEETLQDALSAVEAHIA
jgi:hypothetical protein